MEEKKNYDPELEAFCRLIDREQQRFQLLEERKSSNSARQLPSIALTEKKLPNNSMAWQFELEDFKMSTEDAHNGHTAELSTRRSDHLQGELKGESLLSGTKRMRELTPAVSTATEKKNKTIGNEVSRYAFDLNMMYESLDDIID